MCSALVLATYNKAIRYPIWIDTFEITEHGGYDCEGENRAEFNGAGAIFYTSHVQAYGDTGHDRRRDWSIFQSEMDADPCSRICAIEWNPLL